MKIGNLEVYGIIYKITCLVNNKVYIGQTSQKRGFKDRYNLGGVPIEKVYKYHKKLKNENKTYNRHLFYSIDKYGFDAFKVDEIIDIAFSKTELNIKEECWINFYNAMNPKYGYNRKAGGDGSRPSEATRELFRKKYSGKNNPMYGTHRCGKDNPNYGNKWSEEQRKRMSELKKDSDGIKVICLNDNNVFNSIAKASRFYNVSNSTISGCCLKRFKTIKNNNKKLQFMHYDEYITKTKREIEVIFNLNTFEKGVNPIICLETGQVFETPSKATEFLNKKTNAITNCVNHVTSTAYGFHWKKIEELTKEDYIKYDIHNKLRKLNLIV